MKRSVAFCQVIEPGKGGKTHKVSSKEIAGMFQAVVEAYQDAENIEDAARLTCEAAHVDGSMNAGQKEAKLDWLKAPTPPDTCRVLSNVRCLSEGVDVPALDAVLFLTPRNSQVDVVQSVGRVMRNAPGKQRGYVVLPVVIPAGVEPHEALNDNKTYAVVWQVLQALRSHDDRFDAMVNKLDLVGPDRSKMEVVAIADTVQRKTARLVDGNARKAAKAKGKFAIGEGQPGYEAEVQGEFEFEIGEVERALYAKVVEKCGNRHHWEDWANDIASIAQTHIDRIKALLEDDSQTKAREAFDAFASELRDDLNDKVSDAEIVEMLAQHLITRPVFEALFADYSFAKHNPMSRAMQAVLDVLDELHLEKEADTLQEFYDSVKLRAEGIDSAAGKQKIVVELYDKFFRNAFPKMTERLGIVYTPVEVVDFILHSVDHLLRQEFGQTLGSKGVHILDPFTGTGTFITRLLQSGLIKPEELAHKYRHEIHANELVLLAYYIAAINIEATYHGIAGGDYVPFEGICLTDTFQMYEKEDLVDQLLVDNSKRRRRQKKLDIRVIVGNPPYSAGQDRTNDNNSNISYAGLDARIAETYAARGSATNKNALYDSYIRAIRWASDRIGNAGIIGFVTNAGFLEANTADGLRKCLAEEFSSLYVFHLRGNARTSGETRRKEKDNVFGMGSRAPIAISLLVKNPDASQHGGIHFHDIGDYLSREDKLEIIEGYADIAGVPEWLTITPDAHGDWLKQRKTNFQTFYAIGDRRSPSAVFDTYSAGVQSNRDPWCVNSSKDKLLSNIERTIQAYSADADKLAKRLATDSSDSLEDLVDEVIEKDPSVISWTRGLKRSLARQEVIALNNNKAVPTLYRPYTKQWMYLDRHLVEYPNAIPQMISPESHQNLIIVVKARYSGYGQFSLVSTGAVSDQSDGGAYCFPIYTYDRETSQEGDGALFMSDLSGGPRRRDAITDAGLAHFQSAYPDEAITKEDLFYYVYGLLHSPDYRERYADNLSKELPRIPRVRRPEDFRAFSQAGRDLAALHLGTLTGIPEAAWDYVVNGKAALDWVMERQAVRVDKASGIVNDANDWATETMGNPRYPLELFQRVVTVSLETQKIVASLPPLDIRNDG